jgi:hypothetical protein
LSVAGRSDVTRYVRGAFVLAAALAGCAGERAESPAPVAGRPDSARASNVFDPAGLVTGARVLDMVVERLRIEKAHDSTLVGSVTFAGDVRLRGTLIDHPDDMVTATCMRLDSLSAARLPLWRGDTRKRWLCFSNDSLARAALAGVAEGAEIEVRIRRFTTVWQYSDVYDTAELAEVVRP